jgi:hypothetical protein
MGTMELLLNSNAELINAISVNYRNGDSALLKSLGPLAAFLWLHDDELQSSFPLLWKKAQKSMGAADDDPYDLVKIQEAQQAASDLLDAAKFLA